MIWKVGDKLWMKTSPTHHYQKEEDHLSEPKVKIFWRIWSQRVPPRTPLVGCQVSSTLVGCQRCTDTWFGGPGWLTKSSPKCRAPRGLANSFILKGLDNFVDQISEMMRDTNNNSNNNSSDDDDGAGQFDDTLPIVLPADE